MGPDSVPERKKKQEGEREVVIRSAGLHVTRRRRRWVDLHMVYVFVVKR